MNLNLKKTSTNVPKHPKWKSSNLAGWLIIYGLFPISGRKSSAYQINHLLLFQLTTPKGFFPKWKISGNSTKSDGRKPNEQLFHWLRLRLWPQMMMKRLVFEELIWQMGSCWQPLTLKDEERFPIRDLFHRNLCSSWTKAYILTSWITDPVKIDKHFTSANSRSVFS